MSRAKSKQDVCWWPLVLGLAAAAFVYLCGYMAIRDVAASHAACVVKLYEERLKK